VENGAHDRLATTNPGMNEIPGHAMHTSQLRQRGVTPYELRQPEWRHPYHGIARPNGQDGAHALIRILDALPLLPSCGCLGGWASMYRQGVALVDGLDRVGRPCDVLLHTCARHRLVNRPGIEPTRTLLFPDERRLVEGAWMTTIPRAAYDEMCRASSLTEAVVVVDLAVSRVNGGARTTVDAVRSLIARHRKTRGIRRARAAVELACDRSASQLETRTRIVVLPALPHCDFAVNRPVFDYQGGLLGIPDLLDIRSGLVVESDGSQHGSVDGRSSDHQRDDVFENHGLTVARVTPKHHRDIDTLVRRLQHDHRRALARQRSRPAQWTLDPPDWWARSALAQRWG
jgi:Protein of unknown function (DUF559)